MRCWEWRRKGAMRTSIWGRGRAAIALAALCLVSAGTALAASSSAIGPARAKITIKGGDSFKPNAYITNTYHFVSGTVVIRSGGTVTLTNTTSDAHSLSIVKRSDVPRTVGQVDNCAICGPILQSHGVNPNGPPPSGPPPILLVNVGRPGFDTPGDSILVGPKGRGHSQVSFKVTANPGTTLYFICVIHPWMQGRFVVR